jgi:hypothetical protein
MNIINFLKENKNNRLALLSTSENNYFFLIENFNQPKLEYTIMTLPEILQGGTQVNLDISEVISLLNQNIIDITFIRSNQNERLKMYAIKD